MLVVIAIVAILALVAISSFGAARQQARRDIAIDSVVSSLREQQSLAKSGRLAEDESLNQCHGMLFSVNEPYIQMVEADYIAVGAQGADYCDVSPDSLSDFQPLEDFQLNEVERFGVETTEPVVVLFKPPFADVVLTNDSFALPTPPGSQTTPEIIVRMGLPNDEESRAFRFDTSSGLIERIYETS